MTPDPRLAWTPQRVEAARRVVAADVLLSVLEGRKDRALATVINLNPEARRALLLDVLDVVEAMSLRAPGLHASLSDDLQGEYLITAWPFEVAEAEMEARGEFPPDLPPDLSW